MPPERLTATARRYADLMAASREGHAMETANPVETLAATAAAAAAAVTRAGHELLAAGGKKRKHNDNAEVRLCRLNR